MARATSSLPDVPLFPLATVLFPGSHLELRIFERRYLDLIRECTRASRPFGVCQILAGQEVGRPATPAAIGCLADIVDFYQAGDGVLGICVQGSVRFRVQQVRVRGDGQLRAGLQCWPPEPSLPVPAEFGLLETILQRLLEPLTGARGRHPTECHDDASWVGFRLAETLPLDDGERQQLLEMTDPIERLAWLRDVLPRFQRG